VQADDNTNLVEELVGALEAPVALISRERESALTQRQRELLDELETLFGGDGFAQHSMADLAKQLRCSLNTLYAIAPTRDELVLLVVDRCLRRVGRSAVRAVQSGMSPLESLRAFHAATTIAIGDWSAPFARDIRRVASAQRVADGHERYLADISVALLDAAVEQGEIAPIDTVAVAQVMSQIGAVLTQADVIARLSTTPKQATDDVMNALLAGLRASATGEHRSDEDSPTSTR
jgi:AcrR family transcriptional regulator